MGSPEIESFWINNFCLRPEFPEPRKKLSTFWTDELLKEAFSALIFGTRMLILKPHLGVLPFNPPEPAAPHQLFVEAQLRTNITHFLRINSLGSKT